MSVRFRGRRGARSSDWSACTNRSKILWCISGVIPTPESCTRNTASRSSRVSASAIRPPGSVYFVALLSRFATTCSRRVASPSTIMGSGDSETLRSCLERFGRVASGFDGVGDDGVEVDQCLAELDFATVMREMSKRSSRRRAMWRIWRPAISRDSSTRELPLLCDPIICRMFARGASGLRSSWASMARNSSLR